MIEKLKILPKFGPTVYGVYKTSKYPEGRGRKSKSKTEMKRHGSKATNRRREGRKRHG